MSSSDLEPLLWIYPPFNEELKNNIVEEFRIHPIIAQLLISRGFNSLKSIHDYLYASLPQLHDPFLLSDMNIAVERIYRAIENKETILIYGDNDVDGMTGTALLVEFLQRIGGQVVFFISTRGGIRQNLIVEALDYAVENNCKLLITVDCGITAAAEVATVITAGLEVIITDHHEPTDTLPQCTAILNPKLDGSIYPNRDLAGVGVAFKLAHALAIHLTTCSNPLAKKIDLKKELDLVLFGSTSDMVSLLVKENRILVKYGLRELKKGKRIGLVHLFSLCEVELSEVDTFVIASKIAPRLNSLGRIDDPRKGVEMLLVKDEETAARQARELDLNNNKRQNIERLMAIDVEEKIRKESNILANKAIILVSDKWHSGVSSILSTHLAKKYTKPAIIIVLNKEEGVGKGSGRSIRSFPLLEELKKCSDILLNFGGHDFAAGLTIKEENIPEFKRRFIESANAKLKDIDVIPKLALDAEVKFSELTFDLIESAKLLEPYGNDNPPPLFYSDVWQASQPKIVGGIHLKLSLEQKGRMFEGIALGQGERIKGLRKKNLKLRIAFTPQFRSNRQLLIKGIKIINDYSHLSMEEINEIKSKEQMI